MLLEGVEATIRLGLDGETWVFDVCDYTNKVQR
jgi:hypothetical protein